MMYSWHSEGVWHSKYGFRVVYDASSSMNTPVSGVLQERDLIWKPVRLEALVSIQSKLPLIKKRRTRPFGFHSNQENSLVQRHWMKLDPSDQKSIWFSIVVPRYAFIGWLADRSRLVIQDRLLQWGYNGDTACIFCRSCFPLEELKQLIGEKRVVLFKLAWNATMCCI